MENIKSEKFGIKIKLLFHFTKISGRFIKIFPHNYLILTIFSNVIQDFLKITNKKIFKTLYSSIFFTIFPKNAPI